MPTRSTVTTIGRYTRVVFVRRATHIDGAVMMRTGAARRAGKRHAAVFQSVVLPAYAAAWVFGYLCGSIPFGLIITRLAGTRDIRSSVPANIGATNVLRPGAGARAATLVGDALKGTSPSSPLLLYDRSIATSLNDLAIPAAFRRLSRPPVPALGSASRAAGRRHLYRPFLGLAWPVAGRLLPDLARVAAITRYSSLAALVAPGRDAFALWMLGTWPSPHFLLC